jgi:poly(A) polymerase
LHRLLLEDRADAILQTLLDDGVLTHLIPELDDVLKLEQERGDNNFKDVWFHTKQVVMQAPKLLSLRWAALFHDLGKGQTYSKVDGKVTFHRHEQVSAKIFKTFARRWNIFTPDKYMKISDLIYNLGYIEGYSQEWKDSAVTRLMEKMGSNIHDLIELSAADVVTRKERKRQRIMDDIEHLRERIRRLSTPEVSPFPKGLGHHIMKRLGLSAGPEIGKLKKILVEDLDAGVIPPLQDCEFYVNHLLRKDNGNQ